MNFYDVLAAKNWGGGIPTINFFDLLFAQSMGGGERWKTYEGTLPATLNANGSDLKQYQIYGADGGVGDRTVNLFNFERTRSNLFTFDTTKYIFGASADRMSTSARDITYFSYDNSSFTINTQGGTGIGYIVKVEPNFTYTLKYKCSANIANDRTSAACNLISSTGTLGTFWGIYGNTKQSTFTTSADTKYVLIVFRTVNDLVTYSEIMLTEGSTPPASFVPFGYKLDMSVSDGTTSTTTPIYIGDDPLGEDEYVDYEEGKVYRMIDGTLMPTDPPVPLPALPTCEGTTVIDYSGQSVAPEKVVFEYKKGGN